MSKSILAEAQQLADYTSRMRRDFHQHPELGFKEYRTSGVIAHELGELGLEVTKGVAGTGVVAMLEGTQPDGPTVLLRFDMDALPVQEETGAEYASTVPGVMHACGHDGHVSVGLTVAKLLKKHQNDLVGSIKFVFQPAEEGDGGARSMVKAGILANPSPKYVLAIHLWNEKPLGWVAMTPGPLMAGADMFHIEIEGIGGHAAVPHFTVDPILAAAHIATALQSVVSRNVSPLKSAVVSLTQIKAGDTYNVIPQRAELFGTIRTFEAEVRQVVIERMERIVTDMASAMGCKAKLSTKQFTLPVNNDAKVASILENIVLDTFPGVQIVKDYQTMVSEDMAFLLNEVPGCFLLLGSANVDKGLCYGHHNPKFDFDEAILPNAVAFVASAAIELLKH